MMATSSAWRTQPRDEDGRFAERPGAGSLASNFDSDERALFKEVTGRDIPSDPQEARDMLAKGDFSNTTDAELIALDDKFIAEATPPDVFKENGLDRDKYAGQFDTLYEADVWAGENHAFRKAGISDGETKALSFYARAGYQSINGGLRRGGGDVSALRENERALVRDMDSAFRKAAKTDRPIALFRRGAPPAVIAAFENGEEAGLLGQVFSDDGFTSTTLNHNWLSQAVGGSGEMRMVLPKGSKVLSLQGAANLKGAPEREMLLPRGARYKVTKVGRRGSERLIEMEILPDD